LIVAPVVAFDDQLWMSAQTLAYSSPDGLTWTQHDKTDWAERIYPWRNHLPKCSILQGNHSAPGTQAENRFARPHLANP
jgi:hypothetical protein